VAYLIRKERKWDPSHHAKGRRKLVGITDISSIPKSGTNSAKDVIGGNPGWKKEKNQVRICWYTSRNKAKRELAFLLRGAALLMVSGKRGKKKNLGAFVT